MQKLDWKAYRQFAADNNLRMSIDFDAMGLCQVSVHGIDGGVVEGQGNCIQAAIFSSAVKLSGKAVKIKGEVVDVPVLVGKKS